jgi:hypothetical protein
MAESLRADVPVYDDDGNGCYSWMSIRAGQNSKFCKDVAILGDLSVEGSYLGLPGPSEYPVIDQDIVCGPQLIAPAGTTQNDAIRLVNDWFCAQLALPKPPDVLVAPISCGIDIISLAGTPVYQALTEVSDYYCNKIANLPPAPPAPKSILALQLITNRVYAAGTLFPPVPLFWDERTSSTPDVTYDGNTGLFTILTPGKYKFTTTISCIIENETATPMSKLMFYLAHPNIAAPTEGVLLNQSTFSGQDTGTFHTSSKVLSIPPGKVPYDVATAVSTIDPAPTEPITLVGQILVPPQVGATNMIVERLGDAELPVNVQP